MPLMTGRASGALVPRFTPCFEWNKTTAGNATATPSQAGAGFADVEA